MRKVERYPVTGSNSLWQLYRILPFWRVFRNVVVILIVRFVPFFGLKNALYRLLGIQIGEKTAIALMAVMDVLYPERISIGKNTIIGYNATILTHEYLIDEYRVGDVRIGNHVMIGAGSIILPGVTIGDYAVVGAGSVVNRDVPPFAFVAGQPARILRYQERKKEEMKPQT